MSYRANRGSDPAFRRRRWPRRQRSREWLCLLQSLVPSLALLGGLVSLAAWLLTSPGFVFVELVVEGTERVPVGWVEERVASEMGTNLFVLPPGEIQKRLREHPWISAVEIRKELPDRLHVSVVEHQPAAILRWRDDDAYYLTGEGDVITRCQGGEGWGDLLIVTDAGHRVRGETLPGPEGGGAPPQLADGSRAVALRNALEVVRRLTVTRPEWGAGLVEMEILGDEDYRLYIAELPFPILVRSRTVEAKIRVFEELLPEILHRFREVAAVDLRFSRRIVVQPAVEPAA